MLIIKVACIFMASLWISIYFFREIIENTFYKSVKDNVSYEKREGFDMMVFVVILLLVISIVSPFLLYIYHFLRLVIFGDMNRSEFNSNWVEYSYGLYVRFYYWILGEGNYFFCHEILPLQIQSCRANLSAVVSTHSPSQRQH